ncbi:MAG: TlyA family RNA methyltransferase [Desulfuromonadaceae bacterium]|nr:TlyA family RNA methyltransferase [Desulfuromonadaceae bacterium]
MARKERLDKLLVERGLVPSRERARALILAGRVVAAEQLQDKAGVRLAEDVPLRLKGEDIPFVSRGGLKLASALVHFQVNVSGRTAIDVGASTGGFTDCLLQNGAARVFAVDVGYGQLAWKLRQDPRVTSLERTNIRELASDSLGERPSLAVIDCSFISLTKVLPPTLALLSDNAEIIALIKPQFEVGRGQIGKGGIVRDADQREAAVKMVGDMAVLYGCLVRGVIESPITGAKGNREYLIHLVRQGTRESP